MSNNKRLDIYDYDFRIIIIISSGTGPWPGVQWEFIDPKFLIGHFIIKQTSIKSK